MTGRIRLSLGGHVLAALGLLLAAGCTMDQDLGTGAVGEPKAAPATSSAADDPHDRGGFGADWACPPEGTSPSGRDQACPLGQPIEGDACSSRSTAPCSYEHGDETIKPKSIGSTAMSSISASHAVCICGLDQRWSCLADVTFRSMSAKVHTGDACAEGLMAGGATTPCRCVRGKFQCEAGS